MNIDVTDVIKHLEEVLDLKIQKALMPDDEVHKQYAALGEVEGVKSCIRKFKHYEEDRREY